MQSELHRKGSGQRGIRPFRQLRTTYGQHLGVFLRFSNLPNMRVASIPALFASAEASSIESALPQKQESQ